MVLTMGFATTAEYTTVTVIISQLIYLTVQKNYQYYKIYLKSKHLRHM